MKRASKKSWLCASLLAVPLACVSCGVSSQQVSSKETSIAPAASTIPAEYQSAIQNVLGAETDILAYGDLSKTGTTEVLGANRLKAGPTATSPGTLVTRVSILEKTAGAWREIFRCDDHLHNPNGFLADTPLAPVSGWRLQYERDESKGLEMYFTPIAKPAGGNFITIGVRWNPKVNRYQSLDKTFKQFLGEQSLLEIPEARARL